MRLEELERELRAERQEPDPEFARRLDEWAAAGFPRGGEPHVDHRVRRKGAPRRLLDRLRALPPRRVLLPVGAAASLAVVVAVVVSQRDYLFGGAEGLGSRSGEGGPALPELRDQSGSAADLRRSQGKALELNAAPGDAGATVARDDRATAIPVPPPGDGGGGIASGTENRIIDATASLVLGAEAGEVQDVANGVVEVTDRHEGIVQRSQVTSDQDGARAVFELEIPAKRLDAAITDLSELGDVVSRTEGGEDITTRAVRAQRALAETLEDIQQARIQLIRTDDPEQRRIIRSRIRFLDATADQHRAELAGVQRQGRFATVSVEVTSNGAAAGEDGWDLGEAADDAVDVLETVGGVLLVSLAVLIPLTALGAVAWLAIVRTRRASRERALDRS